MGTGTTTFAELASEPDGIDDPSRMKCFHFHSAILPDDRTLSIYLPPQYEAEPERRFPVFYLHDGQNLFNPRSSYVPGKTWRAGSTADAANAAGTVEPLILVGVANTGLRRMAEYTPTRDFRMGGGEGRAYGRLLIEEVKPFVDCTFRTNPEASHTGLGGSSLGGLISLFLGLESPGIFTRLGVLSPSIWWDHRSVLNFVAKTGHASGVHIWLDIGTGEGARHVRDCELLDRLLRREGWTAGVDLQFVKVPDALHEEDAWAERFGEVLQFLFPA